MGDLSTFYLKQPYGYVFQSGDRSSWLIFDLGGAFSVNRVRLIQYAGHLPLSRQAPNHY